MSAFGIRDAPFGQLCRLALGPRVFRYPDEQEGFEYQPAEETPPEAPTPEENSDSTDTNADMEKAGPVPSPGQSKSGYQTVGWYSDSDLENPQVWSLAKKTITFTQICLLTFAGQFTRDLARFVLTGYSILWICNHHSSPAGIC
jgi:DHA1 family multidrug resistance protein-like MFS transporter